MSVRYLLVDIVLGKRRSAITLALVLFVGVSLPVVASDIDKTDSLVRQWLVLEQQSAALKADWQQERPVLQQRLLLLQREKDQLQEVLQENKNNRSEVETRRAELLAEQTTMESEQQQLHTQLKYLTQHLQMLAPQLPPPLVKVCQDEQAVLTEDSNLSQQLQVAIAQLSKLMEFDSRITLHEMSLTTPEGQQVLVKQLYLGMSVAWFVSNDGSYAGIGYPAIEGWQWQFDEDMDSDSITQAIAIYEKQQQADLIQMPLSLTSGAFSSEGNL